MANNPHPRLLTIRDVQKRTAESRSTIYAKMRRGEFPMRVKIGPRRSAWVESEIDEYIQRQIDNRVEA